MENNIEKFINQAYINKLDADEKDKYIEYVKNMKDLVYDLIVLTIKQKESTNSKEVEEFIRKICEIEKYLNVTEWKYYMIDIYQDKIPDIDEAELVNKFDVLFEKYRNN